MQSTNNKFCKGNTDPKEEGTFTGCVKILCTTSGIYCYEDT